MYILYNRKNQKSEYVTLNNFFEDKSIAQSKSAVTADNQVINNTIKKYLRFCVRNN